jgi:methylphosphotriester-DNA--protein-cysteine methyltransferase
LPTLHRAAKVFPRAQPRHSKENTVTRDEFLNVYVRMTDDQKEQLDDLIQEKAEVEQQLEDLAAKLRQMTPQEAAEAERFQDEYLQSMAEEAEEIANAEYAVDDPEEAESLRQLDWARHYEEKDTRLIEDFPAGVVMIEEQIENIEAEMRKLVPIK